MLYPCWQRIVRENRQAVALRELSSRAGATVRAWTFGQLDDAASRHHFSRAAPAFPSGLTIDFILQVIAAWRDQAILCPLEPNNPRPVLPRIPDGIAHLKITSATAGVPRLVAFTAEQLAADADNIIATMGLQARWPNLAAISLAHSYGFSNLVLPLLLHGIPLILIDSPLPETLKRALNEFGPVTLPAVPALWRTWHEAGVLSGDAIRLAISAGAPLPLARELAVFEQHGLKIHNFYGASECGGIAYDTSTVPRREEACVGAPLCNVSLQVGPDGCLEVRGRAVGTSYLPEPGPALQDGCHRTSDLAEIRDGQVYLRGRASDLINVAGRKVSPEAIERELLAHPAVHECLVFGVTGTDSERGDLVVACVVSSATPPDEAGLKQFLLSRLPAWQVPREWRFVETLAPNERGKLSRAQWRLRLGYGATVAPSA